MYTAKNCAGSCFSPIEYCTLQYTNIAAVKRACTRNDVTHNVVDHVTWIPRAGKPESRWVVCAGGVYLLNKAFLSQIIWTVPDVELNHEPRDKQPPVLLSAVVRRQEQWASGETNHNPRVWLALIRTNLYICIWAALQCMYVCMVGLLEWRLWLGEGRL